MIEAISEARRHFTKTNIDKFLKMFQARLDLVTSYLNLKSKRSIDQAVSQLISQINKAISTFIPLAWTCTIKLHWGFNFECKETQMQYKQLNKWLKSLQIEELQEKFRLARYYKGCIMCNTKYKEFRLSQREMCKLPDIRWKVCKYGQNTAPCQACLPLLNRNQDFLSVPDLVNSPQTKAKLLQTSFFPSTPKLDLSDILEYIYSTSTSMPSITQKEIEKAIFKSK